MSTFRIGPDLIDYTELMTYLKMSDRLGKLDSKSLLALPQDLLIGIGVVCENCGCIITQPEQPTSGLYVEYPIDIPVLKPQSPEVNAIWIDMNQDLHTTLYIRILGEPTNCSDCTDRKYVGLETLEVVNAWTTLSKSFKDFYSETFDRYNSYQIFMLGQFYEWARGIVYDGCIDFEDTAFVPGELMWVVNEMLEWEHLETLEEDDADVVRVK